MLGIIPERLIGGADIVQLGRKASYTVILAALINFINLSKLIGIVDLVTLTKLIQRIKLRESLAGYLRLR